MATQSKSKADDKLDPYTVKAVGVSRRCRGGRCFGEVAEVVELTAAEARQISDDPYLNIVAVEVK